MLSFDHVDNMRLYHVIFFDQFLKARNMFAWCDIALGKFFIKKGVWDISQLFMKRTDHFLFKTRKKIQLKFSTTPHEVLKLTIQIWFRFHKISHRVTLQCGFVFLLHCLFLVSEPMISCSNSHIPSHVSLRTTNNILCC